jgi:hypothetical protein
MQAAYAVRMHDAVTGGFVGSMTRRSHDGREPPPRCVNCRLLGYELKKAAG